MNRINIENIKSVFIVLLWAFGLFSQHVICFDLFDSNYLYLYVLAMLCALAQYILLRHGSHMQNARYILKICFVLYTCVAVLKIVTQIYFFRFTLHVKGLDVLCLSIDVIGALFTLLTYKKHKTGDASLSHKTGDGSAS